MNLIIVCLLATSAFSQSGLFVNFVILFIAGAWLVVPIALSYNGHAESFTSLAVRAGHVLCRNI